MPASRWAAQFQPRNEEEQAQAITRLVDGSLRPDERAAVQAWASERPEITRQVAAQREVASALGTGGPAVPGALVAAVRNRVTPPRRRTRGTSTSPTPGITYPNYVKFAVTPTGARIDRIGGRLALTVFYRLPNGHGLSYTVFSGRPVSLPCNARTVVFDGVPLRTFSTSSKLSVVTLVRFGRTCVLAAPTRRDLVLALAAQPVREAGVAPTEVAQHPGFSSAWPPPAGRERGGRPR